MYDFIMVPKQTNKKKKKKKKRKCHLELRGVWSSICQSVLLYFKSIVPKTRRKSRKKTLILKYVARYGALIRILVILYLSKVKVTGKGMNYI